MSQEMAQQAGKTLTTTQVLSSLKERVSNHNAQLLLHSALVQIGRSGQEATGDVVLNQDDATKLCLILINQGGPAFQVGKSLYKQVLQ